MNMQMALSKVGHLYDKKKKWEKDWGMGGGGGGGEKEREKL